MTRGQKRSSTGKQGSTQLSKPNKKNHSFSGSSKKSNPQRMKRSMTEEQPKKKRSRKKKGSTVPQKKATHSIHEKEHARKRRTPKPSNRQKRKQGSGKRMTVGLGQLKKGKKKGQSPRLLTGVRKTVRDFILVLSVTAFLFLFISSFFFSIERVQGYSMMPTLTDKDSVFIQKKDKVSRMDIVLFQRGQTKQVRRVIGLPGERIEYRDDVLYVNGEVVDEKFIIDEINEAQKNGGQYTQDFKLMDISGGQTIPDKCYLVLADNREYGSDSREYGLITDEQIIGVVKARVLPLDGLTGF